VLVFVNGCFIGRNDNGYAPFRFDLTDFLNYGGKNYIVARVDASFGDGWFYEGAGIYRHVWLTKTDALHLGKWESTCGVDGEWGIAHVELLDQWCENEGRMAESATGELADFRRGGQDRGHGRGSRRNRSRRRIGEASRECNLLPPRRCGRWMTPNLYSAIVTVESGGKARDAERVSFGVRTAVFDADKGFFLNGKPVKIQRHLQPPGSCRCGRGASRPAAVVPAGSAAEMGGNAVRTSHNMPTPEWVEACDRMGMMMMCETRQMSSNPEGWRNWRRWSSAIAIRPRSFSGPSATKRDVLQSRWQGARSRRSMVRAATNSIRRACAPPR
jgi:beta-galactosidase